MNETFKTILTVLGLGIGGCVAVFLLVLLVLLLTGRWMIIPTLINIIPQLFRTGFSGIAGIFGGVDIFNNDENVDDTLTRSRTREATSAADRIRQRREQFNKDTSLSPERRPFEQAGQRGKLSDRYDIRPSKTIHADSDSRHPSRDDRRREWNEDEIFGGMFEDE